MCKSSCSRFWDHFQVVNNGLTPLLVCFCFGHGPIPVICSQSAISVSCNSLGPLGQVILKSKTVKSLCLQVWFSVKNTVKRWDFAVHCLKCHQSIDTTLDSNSVKSPFVRIGAFCSFVLHMSEKYIVYIKGLIALSFMYDLKVFVGSERCLPDEFVTL